MSMLYIKKQQHFIVSDIATVTWEILNNEFGTEELLFGFHYTDDITCSLFILNHIVHAKPIDLFQQSSFSKVSKIFQSFSFFFLLQFYCKNTYLSAEAKLSCLCIVKIKIIIDHEFLPINIIKKRIGLTLFDSD